jgi:hypothetical protein
VLDTQQLRVSCLTFHQLIERLRKRSEVRDSVRAVDSSGNFFESALPSGDLVVLSLILHDWDDERGATILRHCERAIEPGGRLLVIDQVMAEVPNRQTSAVIADLQMLATLPGRERTESEFMELLAAAGLRLQTATATDSPLWLLEAARP